MSKRSSNHSSLLSLGVKRIRVGNESERGKPSLLLVNHLMIPMMMMMGMIIQIKMLSTRSPNVQVTVVSQIVKTQISLNLAKFWQRTQSRQARYVQAGWFTQHPWLSLCETRKKLFCYYCSVAERKKLMTFSNKAEDTFSKLGFCNWKKA
jgi:hypothetical protein